MSDSGTTDKSIWANLPPEIVAHVISLLPIKSLSRFKCVSPSWNSLISSPHFAQTLINRTYTNTPPKTILISSSGELYSVDFANENPTAKLLDYPSVEHSNNWVPLLSSCNGLVLVSYLGNSNFLLNPFTSEYKELPKSPFLDVSLLDGSYYLLPGLGNDTYTNDFKVVMLPFRPFRHMYSDSESESESEFDGDASIADAAIYSLKIDAWRRIQVSHYASAHPVPGVCFNERLHWFCWRTSGLGVYKVVAFDLADEIVKEMRAPASSNVYELMFHRMAVLGGCLSLVVGPLTGQIDVWMMMKYGVGESWTKFTIANPRMSIVDVLYLSAEHEFVLSTNETIVDANGVDGAKLVVYNPIKETLRDMVVSGIPATYTFGENYIETLVSHNHGGRIRGHCEASLSGSSESYRLGGKEHPCSSPSN